MKAAVYFHDKKAGILSRIKNGYEFRYLEEYLRNPEALPLSYNLPLRLSPFRAQKLFPFFENLTSEGWLLSIQSQTQKIDENDSFSLLLENGEDLIGAVKILKEKD